MDNDKFDLTEYLYGPSSNKDSEFDLTTYLYGPTPADNSSDFFRGFKNVLPQAKESFGAAEVLLGKKLGSKRMMQSGMEIMQGAQEQQVHKATDSFTKALNEGIGAVITDWLPYQVGSGLGNVLESLAFAGAGAVAGAGVASIPNAAAGFLGKELLKKEIKEQALKEIARGGPQAGKEFIEREAKKALRGLGAEVGIGAQAGMHGMGETTSRALEEAGGDPNKLDMNRLGVASIVHGVAEFFGDKIALGAFRGLGTTTTNNLIKDIAKVIGTTSIKEMPVEAIQTAAERYGAHLSLSDVEALKEYIDSAAAAVGMSIGTGTVGGVRTYMGGRPTTSEEKQRADEAQKILTGETPTPPPSQFDTATPSTFDENGNPIVATAVTPTGAEQYDEFGNVIETTAEEDVGEAIAPTPTEKMSALQAKIDALKAEMEERQKKIDSGTHNYPEAAKLKQNRRLKELDDLEAELLDLAMESRVTPAPTPPAPTPPPVAPTTPPKPGETGEEEEDVGEFAAPTPPTSTPTPTPTPSGATPDETGQSGESDTGATGASTPAPAPAPSTGTTSGTTGTESGGMDVSKGTSQQPAGRETKKRGPLDNILFTAPSATYLNTPAYFSSGEPAGDPEAGVIQAAHDQAFDAFDTISTTKLVNELQRLAKEANAKEPNRKEKYSYKNPLEYLNEDTLVDLYKKFVGTKKIDVNEGRVGREKMAVNRLSFVKQLPESYQQKVQQMYEAALRQEILTDARGRKLKTTSAERDNRRALELKKAKGRSTRAKNKAIADVQQQIDEAQTDEELEALRATEAHEEKVEKGRREAAGNVLASKQAFGAAKISPKVAEAIKNLKGVFGVLEAISKDNAQNAGTRVIAEGLLKLTQRLKIDARITFDPNIKEDGEFRPDTNDIIVKGTEEAGYTGTRPLDQVVLHEVMHYLTDHVIDNKQAYLASLSLEDRPAVNAALNRLDQNFKQAKTLFGKKYNIPTMKEFIAESFSNPAFQSDLGRARVKGATQYKKSDNLFSRVAKNIAASLGFRTDRDVSEEGASEAGVTLKEILEDISTIISLPSADIKGKEVSYSTATPKKAPPQGPSRTSGLDDLGDYLDSASQGVIKRKSLFKALFERPTWRTVATKFQNDRYEAKYLQDVLDLAGKIYREGENRINNFYDQLTLSTSRANNFYHSVIAPLHENVNKSVEELATAMGKSAEETLAFMHSLMEALHEPERREVKYLLSVPLEDAAANRRKEIVSDLKTKRLSPDDAKRLRKELNGIVKNKNNLSQDPKKADFLDINHDDYNVIGLGGKDASGKVLTAKDVVNKRLSEYQNLDPKIKQHVDNVIKNVSAINEAGVNLDKYANYWSDYTENFRNFYGFEHYAPFKGRGSFAEKHSEVDEILDFEAGSGRSAEFHEAAFAFEGRMSVSDNPVLQSISDAIRSTMRAGRKGTTLSIKNAIEQKLIHGKIEKPIPFEDRNKDTLKELLAEEKGPNKTVKLIHYNPDGTLQVIKIYDTKIGSSIRRTYRDVNPLIDVMNQVTSGLGKMHTRYNYNFPLLNFVRDILTNAWTIGAEMGPAEAAKFIGDIVSKVAVRGAMYKGFKFAKMYESGDLAGLQRLANSDPTYKDMFEFVQEGGMVSYIQGLSLKSNFEQLHKQIGRSGVMKNVDELNKFMDMYVNMFELVSRSAAYSIAKRNALGKNQTEASAKTLAAAYAKNLANFEQVGEYGRSMGALYMFFRPSATGAVRAIEAIAPALDMRTMDVVIAGMPAAIRDDVQARNKFIADYQSKKAYARIMFFTLLGLGMFGYLMAMSMAPDDDLGRNEVMNDNMDQWTRYLRFHLPDNIALNNRDTVFQIPWGFGLGAIAAAGAQATSVLSGAQSFGSAASNIFTQIALDSFVPIPFSRMSATDNFGAFAIDSITPSAIRPVLELVINKNGLGHDIYNDANRRMGDAFTGGDNIPQIYKDAALFLVNSTDGTVDWSPNTMYFMSNSYADGVGRMLEIGYGATEVASDRKEFKAKTDLPLLGSFFGTKSNVDARLFAEAEKGVQSYEQILNGFKADPVKYAEYESKYPFRKDLVDYYNHMVGSKLNPLRHEANVIRRDPNLTPADKEVLLRYNKIEQNLIKNEMIANFEAYGDI